MTEQDLTALAEKWSDRGLWTPHVAPSPSLKTAVLMSEGYLALKAERDSLMVEVTAQMDGSAGAGILQAVLDAIKGTLDPHTQIADHPNVKFAQMERLKLVAERDALKAQLEALGPPVPACPQCMVLDVETLWLKEHTDGTWTCGNCEEDIEEPPTYYRQVISQP